MTSQGNTGAVRTPDFRSLFINERVNDKVNIPKQQQQTGNPRLPRRQSHFKANSEPGNSRYRGTRRSQNPAINKKKHLHNFENGQLSGRQKIPKPVDVRSSSGSIRSSTSGYIIGDSCKGVDLLTNEIVQVYESTTMSMRKKRSDRKDLIYDIKAALRNILPCAKLNIFGSCANSLDLPQSDVDCYLLHVGYDKGLRECARLSAQQQTYPSYVVYPQHMMPVNVMDLQEAPQYEEDGSEEDIRNFSSLLVRHLCEMTLLKLEGRNLSETSRKSAERIEKYTQSSCTSSSTGSRASARCSTPPQKPVPIHSYYNPEEVTISSPEMQMPQYQPGTLYHAPSSLSSDPGMDQYGKHWAYYSPPYMVPVGSVAAPMYYYGAYPAALPPRCAMLEPVLTQLELLESGLKDMNFVKGTQLIKSKMPILRLKVCKSRDWNVNHDCSNCVTVDISNGHTPGHTKRTVVGLVRRYQEEFFEFNYLMIMVKKILVERKLNETFTGGLGSFPLVCMLMAFLRDHYEKQFDSEKNIETGSTASSWRGGCSLGRLFLDFLDFYGNKFNPQKTGINVSGKPGHKKPFFYDLAADALYSPIVIDHPILANVNLGAGCYNIGNVLGILKMCHASITAQIDAASNSSNPVPILACLKELGSYVRVETKED